MDKSASNYLASAVVDDESCMYSTTMGDIKMDFTINSYPQPATSYVIIEFKGVEGINNKNFVIHNIVGEKLYAGKVKTNKTININTENWNSGIYYVIIKMENRNLTHKFVVE